AAATALALFAGLWCWLNLRGYHPRNPDELPFGNLLEFSATEQQEVSNFTSIRKRKGQERSEEITYTARKTGERETRFFNANNQVWKRSDADGLVEAIVIELDGQPVRLQAQLTREGYFPADQQACYLEERGGRRYMYDNQLGRIFSFRWGL